MNNFITQWPLTEKFSVIDIEADGNRIAKPIEISILDFEKGKIVNSHYWLINPEQQIQKYVQEHIHGITNKMVKNSPKFHEIENDVKKCLKDKIIVGHGIKSDFSILRSVMEAPENLPSKIIDTSILAKLVLNTKNKIGLEKTCNILGIRITEEFRCNRENFHGAKEDAYATAQLLFELPKLIPNDLSLLKQISNSVVINTNYAKKDKIIKNDIYEKKENEFNPTP